MATKFLDYQSLRKIAEQPLKKRRMVAIGRNGASVKPRKFHLSDDEVAQLRKEHKETGVFPNPHNKGFYFYLIASLVDLGVNEPHPMSRVMTKVESLMSDPATKDEDGKTAWQRFAKRDPRNVETAKDVDGRAYQNVLVLQRLTGRTPYGMKLLEVGQKVLGTKGCVIDVTVGTSGAKFLTLNTKSDSPINQAKVRGHGSPAEVKAKKAAKKSGKKRAKKSKPAPAPAQTATADEPAQTVTA